MSDGYHVVSMPDTSQINTFRIKFYVCDVKIV